MVTEERQMEGMLYVVATPIGNLKDMTFRAVEVLREVEFVVAESRERALKLLSHFEIRKPLITINTYSEERRSRNIIDQLIKGRSAAVISAAGTPCISDPGRILVRKAYEAGVQVISVPGASSVIGAMAVAGLSTDRFVFHGFLPQKKGKRKKILEQLLQYPLPIVLFESPRRVKETLEVILATGGKRFVVIVRELTKVYEEIWRGTVQDFLQDVAPEEGREESTIAVDAERSE
jgi:16S rRNA (cytidine1402-2'-O)-methyltransferase